MWPIWIDADKMANSLDGGKRLAELLKNLPKRHLVIKSGSRRPQEVLVPNVADLDRRRQDGQLARRRQAPRRTAQEPAQAALSHQERQPPPPGSAGTQCGRPRR